MSSRGSVAGVEPGITIQGRYEVRSLLGQGGFASVFRAFDSEIERPVAIKVLNLTALVSGEGNTEVILERFRREAKLAARVSHPAVVQIHDYGVLEGATDNPFIIMEVLEGHDLEQEIEERGPLSPERFVPLFVDTLEALGEAHQLEIVHKDLKPSNLFLANPGQRREVLKVVDFGIAHIGDEGSGERLTRTGFMLGTPQYMAPEYVEEQLVSPALDVYQMALILAELLAGRAVVDATNPWRCAMMHVGRELSLPGPLLDSPLGPVLEKALRLDPADRYDDAGDFADALEAVDIEEISPLSDDVEWWPLADSEAVEASTPDESTQQLFEEAQSARQELTGPEKAGDMVDPVVEADSEPEETADGGDTLEAMRRSERARTLGVIGVGVAAVLLLVAVGMVLSGEEEVSVDDREAVATVDDPETGDERADGDEVEEGAEPEEEEVEPTEEAIEVELEVFPSDATVEVDGEILDEAATTLRFDSPESEPLSLIVEHDEYEAVETRVGPDSGPTKEVELQALVDEGATEIAESDAVESPSVGGGHSEDEGAAEAVESSAGDAVEESEPEEEVEEADDEDMQTEDVLEDDADDEENREEEGDEDDPVLVAP